MTTRLEGRRVARVQQALGSAIQPPSTLELTAKRQPPSMTVLEAAGKRRIELRVEQTVATYPVVGRTLQQRRRAMQMLGPVRHGTTFPAYTDWWLGWSFSPRCNGTTIILGRGEVTLRFRIIVPRARGRAASEEVDRAWSTEVLQLRAHEERHGEAVHVAADGLARTLLELPGYPSVVALAAAVDAAGMVAVAAQIDCDREIDRCDPFPIPFQEHER
jgi:predicted secreted Zn-dependent protease